MSVPSPSPFWRSAFTHFKDSGGCQTGPLTFTVLGSYYPLSQRIHIFQGKRQMRDEGPVRLAAHCAAGKHLVCVYALAWVVHCNAACSVLGTVRSGGSVLCCCLWEQQLRGREMHRE